MTSSDQEPQKSPRELISDELSKEDRLLEEKRKNRSSYQEYLKYSDAGIKFAIYILLGTFGGRWIGQQFGVVDLFTFFGLFLGFGMGTYALYRSLFVSK